MRISAVVFAASLGAAFLVGRATGSGTRLAFAVARSSPTGYERYCQKPDPNASLAVSAGVSCAVAAKIKHFLISPPCFAHLRCTSAGFRCVAYWDGRFDRPFAYSHYALCNDRWRWVVWNGG